ncbi:spartin isoform X1 [Sphaerodactylus townsendi]|uniref:spartin isoform X1 n=1 Tax=Sphaerodactylus townsendi TaxID=933632 RepID=UPI002025CB28|nr:spartin isoform X1 [Sphaerodactylus townsendi]
MEQEQDPAVQENVNFKAIREEYSRAFMFVNKALNADELGQKEEARLYYQQGINHLLKGIHIPSQGPECAGPEWDSVRKMQQKMRETLKNVTARLGILDENVQSNSMAVGAPAEASAEASRLYPTVPAKEKPTRPPVPNSLKSPFQLPSEGASVESAGPDCVVGVNPSSPKALSVEAPPAYTPEATDGHYTVSYGTDSGEFSSVGEEFYKQSTRPPPIQNLGVEADELILIPHGVQIFYVTPDGQVSAPSYPGYLRIVKFLDSDEARAQNRPPAFLQVCDWIYPLMSSRSPVLSCSSGVYMFPDVMSQVSGSYVGVVLSSELPAADRELFEDLLKQMSDLRVQPAEASSDVINLRQTVHIQPEPEEGAKAIPEWSEKVAHGILTGASWVSWGLVKGAEYTGKAIHAGASKLREHIQPDEKPVAVNPTVAKGLQVAKHATGGAVKVSQYLVESVCSLASCVGRELAPHVKKHGSKLVPDSLKKDKDGKSPLDGALVVAASGVQGFSTIWLGLEGAAKCIAKNVSKETVQTVKHKYGEDAGRATDNAVNSAINVGVTAFNIDNIGVKAIVKKTAKEAGHAVLDEYKIIEKEEEKKKKKD